MENVKKINFALIGAAGYIAPRHMKAIRETGNTLVAAVDRHDAVGIMDSYFPEADFFLETERFDRHLDKLRRQGEKKIEYVSICSPNYLHDSHIRLVLRNNACAICEKPLVLNPWNIEALGVIEKETGKKIYNILQLRLHDSIKELKETISKGPKDKIYDIDMTYITSRGHWYFMSWKGDESKSGGIATNIGIHFFDMLIWIFGDVQKNIVHYYSENKAAGFLELKNARVRWFLSIDSNDLPDEAKKINQRTYRSIKIDNKEIEFSEGFTDLHTISYKEILNGNGFGRETSFPSINTVYEIRHAEAIGMTGEYHPLLKKIK
jgi:UDP-N-acetyl-2-amino-2-deoxyglucuronate dehydrogenase